LLSGIIANAMSATSARIITVNASLRNTEAGDPVDETGVPVQLKADVARTRQCQIATA
jgi:hypothetical protein